MYNCINHKAHSGSSAHTNKKNTSAQAPPRERDSNENFTSPKCQIPEPGVCHMVLVLHFPQLLVPQARTGETKKIFIPHLQEAVAQKKTRAVGR